MMTPHGPPSRGCVTSTTLSRKLGSSNTGLATRKIAFADSSAAPAGVANEKRTRRTRRASRIGGSDRMADALRILPHPPSHLPPRREGGPGLGDAARDGRLSRLYEFRDLHAIADGGQFGKDRDRDLRRRLGTELQPHRPVQAR